LVINDLEKKFLKNISRKETMINMMAQFRYRLSWANNWFEFSRKNPRKATVNPLFPHEYFDPTRKKDYEIGFAGTHKQWKEKLKKLKAADQLEKSRVIKANERKRKQTNQQKLTKAVTEMLKKNLSVDQLYNYVSTNLPHDYISQIPVVMEQLTNPQEYIN
jgi:hypothetical protein